MLHNLIQTNLHINELINLQNPKNLIFCGILGHYPQTEIFPQKSGSISFYPLGTLTS